METFTAWSDTVQSGLGPCWSRSNWRELCRLWLVRSSSAGGRSSSSTLCLITAGIAVTILWPYYWSNGCSTQARALTRSYTLYEIANFVSHFISWFFDVATEMASTCLTLTQSVLRGVAVVSSGGHWMKNMARVGLDIPRILKNQWCKTLTFGILRRLLRNKQRPG